MPKLRKFKRRIKRRLKRKSRRGFRVNKGPSTAKLTKFVSGFPDRVKIKLQYSDSIVFSQAASVAAYNVWRGNGIYDPDQTLTGHQPYAYDQWNALYAYSRVYGSKIRIKAIPYLATAGIGTVANLVNWMAVVPSTTTTEPNYPSLIDEMPYAAYRTFSSQQAGSKAGTISKYMSTAKIFGVSPRTVQSEDDFTNINTSGGNPAQQWYWTLICGSIDDQVSSAKWVVTVKLTYYVEFFVRRNLSQS